MKAIVINMKKSYKIVHTELPDHHTTSSLNQSFAHLKDYQSRFHFNGVFFHKLITVADENILQ